MNVLIALSHPAHYYLFKYFYKLMRIKGSDVRFVIREKDILENLLISEEVNYIKICNEVKRGSGKYSILINAIKEMLIQDYNLWKYLRKWRPDIMLGTDICISHIGKIMCIPTIVLNEDDYEVNKLFCLATYPFAKHILSPNICNVGKFWRKKIGYDGYQKIAYLHPNYFQPKENVLDSLGLTNGEPFFVIRLVALNAVHDIEENHHGLSIKLLKNIIKFLLKKGKVFISSEKLILPEFKKYELKINPNEIHDLIYYADLFISDSQSMSVESALIGTPSIRCSSFVGKITVLEELEHKYKLTFGIKSGDEKNVLTKIKEIFDIENIKEEFRERRDNMLKDKIDLTSFLIWIVENYPKSINEIRNNPKLQYKFK